MPSTEIRRLSPQLRSPEPTSFTAICLSFCATTCSTPGIISQRSPGPTNEIILVEPWAPQSCKTSCFSTQATKEQQSGTIHTTSELLFPRQRCQPAIGQQSLHKPAM